MVNIKERLKSDDGASITIEQIGLVVFAIVGLIMFNKYIMQPLRSSSEGIGETIGEMNPKGR